MGISEKLITQIVVLFFVDEINEVINTYVYEPVNLSKILLMTELMKKNKKTYFFLFISIYLKFKQQI